MKVPRIKFVIDAEKDIKNYVLFNRYCGGRHFLKMFLPKELHYVLNGDYSQKEKEKIVKKYVKDNFISREKAIKEKVRAVKGCWDVVVEEYFDLMKKVFKGHPWPSGKYIGFASVFDMYPRDIREKTFHFSGLRKDAKFAVATTAHEMTHFLFFDYLSKKYGIKENEEFGGKNPKYLWNVSEVFNLVMEGWKPYSKIFKTRGVPYDAIHARMLKRMRRIWREREDIDYLLRIYFHNSAKHV